MKKTKSKHSDASKHHAKRPHPSHSRHAMSDQPTKKVFDVMRPGKAPASPSSRPIILGHKAEAQKTQVAVSGIGESAVTPVKRRGKIEIKPLHDIAIEPVVPPSAVTSQVAAMTAPTDPEDIPAGSPVGTTIATVPESPDMEASAAIAPTIAERPAVAAPVLPPSPVTTTESDEASAPAEPTEPPGPPALPEQEPQAAESEAAPEPEEEEPPVVQELAPTLGSLQSTVKLTPPESSPSLTPPPESTPEPAETPKTPEVPAPTPLAPEQGKPTVAAASTPDVPQADDAAEPESLADITDKPAPSGDPDKATAEPAAAVPDVEESDIQDIVVSHHASERNWMAILLLMLVLLLAVVAVDILLDAQIIDFPVLPRSDFL